MDRPVLGPRILGPLAAGLMVLATCLVGFWCYRHGLLDPATRAGHRFLLMFGILAANWVLILAVVFVLMRRRKAQGS